MIYRLKIMAGRYPANVSSSHESYESAEVNLKPKEDEFAMAGHYAMSLLVFDIITNSFAPLRNSIAFFGLAGKYAKAIKKSAKDTENTYMYMCSQVSKKTGKRVKKRWKSQIAGLCNADGSTGVEVEIGR